MRSIRVLHQVLILSFIKAYDHENNFNAGSLFAAGNSPDGNAPC